MNDGSDVESAGLMPSRLSPLLGPVERLLRAESAGGVLLLIAAVAALVWANSPWGDGYGHFWHTPLVVSLGGRVLSMSLEHWVNDGLMVLFFVLVGLEIKRELVAGELASMRQAALPVAAALGGMVVPAVIYFAMNAGTAGVGGWGVPMATDIAFAVGVLALAGRGVPVSVKVFLLAVAIVDDLGAVAVITLFYTRGIAAGALALAGVLFLVLVGLNVLRVHRPLPYVIVGLGLWGATLASGVHSTVAGVLLAFTIPASRQMEEGRYVEQVKRALGIFAREASRVPERITEVQGHALAAMEEASKGVQTPLARMEHALLKPVSFVIVPLFALANAGVDLRGGLGAALGSRVAWGVAAGLLIGKPLGVLGATWLAVKLGIGQMPQGAKRGQILGVGVLCGIGFTMSLFVAALAFGDDAGRLAAAKAGTLAASLGAGVVGGMILRGSGKGREGASGAGGAV